jgi:hypothetical protein
MVFKALQNIVAGAFMIVCLWSIVATSQSQKSIDKGDFYVISDCVTPTLESQVGTIGGQIVTPIGQSYTDYGFPQTNVNLQSPITGTVLGKMRSCYLTYGDKSNGETWIYSCFDNNTFTCSVMIKPL